MHPDQNLRYLFKGCLPFPYQVCYKFNLAPHPSLNRPLCRWVGHLPSEPYFVERPHAQCTASIIKCRQHYPSCRCWSLVQISAKQQFGNVSPCKPYLRSVSNPNLRFRNLFGRHFCKDLSHKVSRKEVTDAFNKLSAEEKKVSFALHNFGEDDWLHTIRSGPISARKTSQPRRREGSNLGCRWLLHIKSACIVWNWIREMFCYHRLHSTTTDHIQWVKQMVGAINRFQPISAGVFTMCL